MEKKYKISREWISEVVFFGVTFIGLLFISIWAGIFAESNPIIDVIFILSSIFTFLMSIVMVLQIIITPFYIVPGKIAVTDVHIFENMSVVNVDGFACIIRQQKNKDKLSLLKEVDVEYCYTIRKKYHGFKIIWSKSLKTIGM